MKTITEDQLVAAMKQLKADAEADPQILAELDAATDEDTEIAIAAKHIFARLPAA